MRFVRLPAPLSVAELVPRRALRRPTFLALDFARIARHESGGPQGLAQSFVVLEQRARDAVSDRARLAGDAAALDQHVDVEARRHLHELERLSHDHDAGLAAEEFVERAAVYRDLALAGLKSRGPLRYAPARAENAFGP